MKDDGEFFLTALFGFGLGIVASVVTFAVATTDKEEWAVEAGYGEYYIDNNYEKEFRWKDPADIEWRENYARP